MTRALVGLLATVVAACGKGEGGLPAQPGPCAGAMAAEVCGNGLDDDCDAFVDAADGDCGPPDAPSDTRVFVASPSTIHVLWQDNSTSEAGFEVHRSGSGAGGTFEQVASTSADATAVVDAGLSPTSEYCYRVRAFSTASGATLHSGFSDAACATTPLAPGLHLTSVTTGVDPDPDGYLVVVWTSWGLLVGGARMPPNGTVTLTGLPYPLADYELVFEGAALNCDLVGPNPRIVELSPDAGVETRFEVSCSPATTIAFTGGSGLFVIRDDATGSTALTADPAPDAAPAWSPDGTRLAFQSGRTGAREIFTMNADGSDVAQLTDGGGNSEPSWSPDGEKIAFVRDLDGNREIYVMDSDGSNAVNVSNDPAVDEQPAWSPDGARIAFRSLRDPHPAGIYLMNPDGSSVERLTVDDGVDDAEPAWSPGGELLAISRWFCSWEWCLRTIWIMSPAGSGAYPWTALNPECETHTQPSWSSDGKKIAFTSTDYCADPTVGLPTVNAVRRTGAERFTPGVPLTPGADPSWRPSAACGDRPCDDGNVCTADACDAATGCVHLPAVGPCDDGNACTLDDACSGGACAGRAPAEVCDSGLDDDCDGLVDGADPDCQACSPTPEICDNGLDDDCNGLVDDWIYCCGCAVFGRLCGDDGFCYDCLQDGVQNGQESDVDCGALCWQQCADGQRCSTDADCASGACIDFVCANRGP